MRGLEILFERVIRNRLKLNKSLNEIANVAMSKMKWCYGVVCKFHDDSGKFSLTIYDKNTEIVIDALDFFGKFEDSKEVSREQVNTCIKYGN